MRSYSNFSMRDLLDAFSSTAPAPGGGGAAALTGAIGVSLLLMSAGIRASRPSESTDSMELADATDRLRSLIAMPRHTRRSSRRCGCRPQLMKKQRAGGPPWRQRCTPQPTSRSK